MNPVRRLTIAGAGIIGGGMIVAAGTRITWATVVVGREPVSAPGLPRVSLGGGRFPFDGGDLGAGYLFGVGLILALVPLAWLATGPRARVALSLAAVALAIVAGFGAASVRSDVADRSTRLVSTDTTNVGVEPGAGGTVTIAGAAVAALAGAWGAVVGGRIPRLDMPEKPGGDAS